jgi:hypothetical protein
MPPATSTATSPGGLDATPGRDDVLTLTRDGMVLGRWSCDATPAALAFADDRTLAVGDTAGQLTLLQLPPSDPPSDPPRDLPPRDRR